MTEHQHDPDDRPLTVRDWKLERRTLVAEFRVTLLIAVAANTFLQSFQIPNEVSAAAFLALAVPPVKAILFGGLK